MSQAVKIRPATQADEVRVGELLIDAFVSTYARKLPNVVVSESRKRDLREVAKKRDTASVLVAELEGEVVGTVTLLRPGDPASRAWTPNTADLRYFAVDPRFHGRGVSKPLVDAVCAVGKSWGCGAICLHVRREAEGLGRFYMSHGWERAPQGDIDKLPEIFMRAYLRQLKV